MLADFPYVWVSRLDLWQVPRTAQSTGRFGVGTAQVTKNTLFDPFRRTRRANTIGPIALKLCRPRDLAKNLEDLKSERRACTLAPPPCRKMRARIRSWNKFRVSLPKSAVAEVVLPHPEHAG